MKTTAMLSIKLSGIAAAGLLLAACSATHVGESWQCPLAQGSSCTSIAEADPAVPASAARPAILFGEALPGARPEAGGEVAGGWHGSGEACAGGCGFFAWLEALFRGDADVHAPRPLPAVPETAAVTVPATGQIDQAASAVPVADASLRTSEVLGRIWIAPFVDADGIYREAHWVRVVLEPAGWKFP